MTSTVSRYRLTSSAFNRDDDDNKILPKRIIFLSVEGDETEKTYFSHLNTHLDSTIIQIEILRHRRGDGYSDPKYVMELLNEYLEVRNGSIIPDEIMESLTKKFSKELLLLYLSNPNRLDIQQQKQIQNELLQIGIDLDYRKYLHQFDKDTDLFGIVIDRDSGSHTKEALEICYKKCKERNIQFYITNPCFEFWLLLHVCDVSNEFSEEELGYILKNAKISNNHTVVSNELSNRVKHRKSISPYIFNNYYYPNISTAIKNSQKFATHYPNLLDNLGTNLPDLFKELDYSI